MSALDSSKLQTCDSSSQSLFVDTLIDINALTAGGLLFKSNLSLSPMFLCAGSESPRAAVGAAVPVAASACDLSSSAAQREEPRAHAPVPSPSEEPRARAPVPSPSPERSPPTPSASQALPERRHSALSAVDPYCRLSDALDFITVRGVVGFRALGEVSAAAAAVAIAVLRLAGSADIGESSVSAAPLKTWEEARRVLLKPGHFVSSLRRYPYAAERGQVLDSDVSAAEETLME
ncbi:unnamed protein product, partial [Polarella glacialis]